jgi:hypothetical protein
VGSEKTFNSEDSVYKVWGRSVQGSGRVTNPGFEEAKSQGQAINWK